ncbi:MAG: anhydro-N-acetylmuramic acid kinase [Chromatiales bacterium]|jgi:anhydro-N-acetylmuramic acid kinase|nr:anhydro-N-acetylmuramic acid kinase [Chromatiales bacterium]MDX9766503.1 anhydro-N-acetylmuramic acid kinase [Ectothiorhodospiraceae bacterium]
MPGRAFYIGLISGTSMDAVDAALVDLTPARPQLLAALAHPIPEDLQRRLRALADPAWRGDLDEYGALDVLTGELFAEAALAVVDKAGIPAVAVLAIGSHGQTVRHRPEATPPFTLQIGNPHVIAARTGITTVADFRPRDIAVGGQGAPLVPALHAALFRSSDMDRVVLNVGGIANVTLLPADDSHPVTGFDTGPGNTLMDLWTRRQLGRDYDKGGTWAATGTADAELVEAMLADPWFALPPPKSTGPEHFSRTWLERHLEGRTLASECVQRSLLELTARSIAQAIERHAAGHGELLVCGGGAHNRTLLQRLRECLPGMHVMSTAQAGLDPDWVEAVAFAWLARQTLRGLPGNLPEVTGASGPAMLGSIHPGRRRG